MTSFTSIPLHDIIHFLICNNQQIPTITNDIYSAALKLLNINTNTIISMPTSLSNLLITYSSNIIPISIRDWITMYNLQIKSIISGNPFNTIIPVYKSSFILTHDDLHDLSTSLSLHDTNKGRIIRTLGYINKLDNDMNVFDILPADVIINIISYLNHINMVSLYKVSRKFFDFYKLNKIIIYQSHLRRQISVDNYDAQQLTRLMKLMSYHNTIECGGDYNTILTNSGDVYKVTQEIKPIMIDKNIIQISAKYYHTLLLSNNGEVYGYAFNNHNQLGLSTINIDVPTIIPIAMDNDKVIQISAGNEHSLILTIKGKVFSFGSNQYGQLGHKLLTENITIPKLISKFQDREEAPYIIQISAGYNNSLLLTEDGYVYIFGNLDDECLGLSRNGYNYGNSIDIPTLIPDIQKIICISCGIRMSMFLTETGKVYILGVSNDGEFIEGSAYYPVLIPNIDNIISISCEIENSLLLTNEYQVYLVDILHRSVSLIPNIHNIAQISANYGCSLLLDNTGDLYAIVHDNDDQKIITPKFVMSVNM